MARSNGTAAYAAFEEIMRRAMDEALNIQSASPVNDQKAGELQAYFNIIEWGKQQAELQGVEIIDQELKDFDPYTLLVKKAA